MKILFLDVDGVLNSTNFALSERNKNPGGIMGMDYLAVDLLRNIVLKTNCKIVLSSTWRIFKWDVFVKELQKHDPTNLILNSTIGTTPNRNVHPEMSPQDNRGLEIQKWIDENNFTGSFVIVDDDSNMAHLSGNFIKTEFKTGLTKKNEEEIILKLNSQEKRI